MFAWDGSSLTEAELLCSKGWGSWHIRCMLLAACKQQVMQARRQMHPGLPHCQQLPQVCSHLHPAQHEAA